MPLGSRRHFAIIFLAFVGTVALANTIYKTINTVNALNSIESERDQWQRPEEIIKALDLRNGSSVVDLGCGAGYFTLKLATAVGKDGHVQAVDIRKLSLVFLWIRTLTAGIHNVFISHVSPEQPNLAEGNVHAVLVANTYHEFERPQSMLGFIRASLVPGGVLVIVDRRPRPASTNGYDKLDHQHGVRVEEVQQQVIKNRFDVIRRDDNFIERPDEIWWLLVARKAF